MNTKFIVIKNTSYLAHIYVLRNKYNYTDNINYIFLKFALNNQCCLSGAQVWQRQYEQRDWRDTRLISEWKMGARLEHPFLLSASRLLIQEI